MVDSKAVINLTIIAALLLFSTTPSGANQQFSESSTRTNTSCLVDTDCPIWAECNNTKCVCKINLQSLRTVLCGENLQLSVIRCHCLTYDNRTDELFEGKCIENVYYNEFSSPPLEAKGAARSEVISFFVRGDLNLNNSLTSLFDNLLMLLFFLC